MKWFWLFVSVVIAIGMLMILIGFAYDVMFAGIPYQDPTPELAARYALHARIATIIRWVGVGVCLSGGGIAVLSIALHKIGVFRL